MHTCSWCGNKIENDSWCKDPKDKRRYICDDCYRDNYTEDCPLCEDYYEKSEIADAFCLAPETAKDMGMKPGIYKIKEYPFYYGNCVTGFDDFFEGAIELIKEIEFSNFQRGCEKICKHCYEEHIEEVSIVTC